MAQSFTEGLKPSHRRPIDRHQNTRKPDNADLLISSGAEITNINELHKLSPDKDELRSHESTNVKLLESRHICTLSASPNFSDDLDNMELSVTSFYR